MAQETKLDRHIYPALRPVILRWSDYLVSEKRVSKHTHEGTEVCSSDGGGNLDCGSLGANSFEGAPD